MHNASDTHAQPAAPFLVVLGTRPEAIKLAPLINALRARTSEHAVRVAVTGQHRDMVAPILKFFGIAPEFDLDIMRENQSPAQVVERTLEGLDPIAEREPIGTIIVQGDTASALAAALTGFYRKIPVVHVEAGLRTGNIEDPFPEEMNRRLIGQLATLHCAPTEANREALLKEGIAPNRIRVTGNTVIDALEAIVAGTGNEPMPEELNGLEGSRTILLTTHRRENFGEPQQRIFEAVNALLEKHSDLAVLFPVHPNPNVRRTADRILKPNPRLRLTDPIDYITFVRLMRASWLIMTDSGGIQEEAPALGRPALVLRNFTEREEALATDNTVLVGTSTDAIVGSVEELLRDESRYRRMTRPSYPFGAPGASERIADMLLS